MPIEQAFSDRFGNENPSSFWVISKLNLDVKARVAVFNFNGYKSKGAYQQGKEPVSTYELLLTEAEFDALVANLDLLLDQVENKSLTKDFFKTGSKKPKA